MEDTHGDANPIRKGDTNAVLILIIMEDTHGVFYTFDHLQINLVLILIIMEDTHGDPKLFINYKELDRS